MTTFLEMAQNLADRTDRPRPTTIYNADLSTLTGRIRRWRETINLAYNIVLLALNRTNEYRESSTTLALISGTESYNIPATILNVDQVQIGTDPPMDIMQWDDFETYKRQFLMVTDTGYPTACAIYQRKLWFYPIPDQNMTANIRGQELMTAMDADSDTPDLTADFHRVIQELAIQIEQEYLANPAAGTLIVQGSTLSGQGGTAARVVYLLELAKNNMGDHFEEAPRMKSRYEPMNKNALRRVIY